MPSWLDRRRAIVLMIALAVAGWLSMPRATVAQGQECFNNIPGITNCIQGRFYEYWLDNGGLPVFGYPITGEFLETTAEGQFTVQYFERNVLELHPTVARPYDVQLGPAGRHPAAAARAQLVQEPKGRQSPDCYWAEQTQHSICGEFAAYWESHGLNDPQLDPQAQSLALFGLPLTEPAMEQNAAGDTVMTQWFERARLEFHPGVGILLGLLGVETREDAPPPDNGEPPPPEGDPCAGIAEPRLAQAEPNCIPYGGTFRVTVYDFDPNERISFWITDETGVTVGAQQQYNVDGSGSGYVDISTLDYFGYTLNPGNYVFVAQDSEQEFEPSIAPFRVIP